jgi:hypothetical protein
MNFNFFKSWKSIHLPIFLTAVTTFVVTASLPKSVGNNDTSSSLNPTMKAYIGFYRTYHRDSNDKDVQEYIERLLSLWVYSESDFSKYCSAFPAMSELMAAEFEKQINSSDLLGIDRFRPIRIHTSEGRIDLLSSGIDREIWIASYPSSETVPGYGLDS